MPATRKYDIGFFSSADRGLDILLGLIPKIEAKLGRKVTSCWAYGWDIYDNFHAQNPEKMKFKWQVIRAMNQTGMESLGRLSHEKLAEVMKDTNVWAYPTEFDEIHCMTALKAQAAKCQIVTSGYAALQETILKDEKEVGLISSKPKELDKFVSRVVEALKTPRDEAELQKVADKVKKDSDWSRVARRWDEVLK